MVGSSGVTAETSEKGWTDVRAKSPGHRRIDIIFTVCSVDPTEGRIVPCSAVVIGRETRARPEFLDNNRVVGSGYRHIRIPSGAHGTTGTGFVVITVGGIKDPVARTYIRQRVGR